MRPRVLLVDDQEDFRAVARQLMVNAGGEVVGEAGGAEEALRSERDLRPDVVLLDVRLPDGSGIDVARAMAAAEQPPTVLLVSTADYAYAVAECGAAGFVLKQQLSTAALRELLGTSAGGTP
jgi:DNA-binding NarL/FixJ family response regulator